MSLIYGFSDEKDNDGSGSVSIDVSDLEKLVGEKTDSKTADSAFGRIKKNKEDIKSKSILLGLKSDPKTADTAFGKIKKNKTDLSSVNSFIGSSNSSEGTPNLKGTQLSHASAITAHAGNLLNLEDAVGLKTNASTADTAFGKIQKNKENIEKLRHAVELRETTGTFVAPTNDGKVEITGWTMTRYSTIIAIIIKAKQGLLEVSRVTLYSGTSLYNNNHTMTVPMTLADMKLGKPAVITHTKDPGHARMYANTRGNAVGSVAERTVTVKFIYIDHTSPILN